MVRSVREHFGLRICNVFGIARRTLTIALNPGENPSARQGFRHDPFETWLREERPEISAQRFFGPGTPVQNPGAIAPRRQNWLRIVGLF